MTRYAPDQLAEDTSLEPVFEKLVETNDEWWVGGMAFRKASASTVRGQPTYRRGWTFALEVEMRLVTIPFTRADGTAAIAIVLRSKDEDILATWMPASRTVEADYIVAHLNREIEGERAQHEGVEAAGNAQTGNAPRTLTIETGAEFAPDAPWGAQSLTLNEEGSVRYEQRCRGSVQRRSGRISRARAARVFSHLAAASFPTMPQHRLPPGASLVTLEVSGNTTVRIQFQSFFARGLVGYAELLEEAGDLVPALRSDDPSTLGAWSFEPDDTQVPESIDSESNRG